MARRSADVSEKELYLEVLGRVSEVVGSEWATSDEAILIAYSRDQSLEVARNPNIVVLPGSAQEVSEILRIAWEFQVPVTPWSTGGNTGGGCIPQSGGIVCDLRRMDRITGFDKENMSVRIQPGVTFGKVFAEAQKRGLRNICPSAPASVSMLSNYLDKGVFQISNRYGVGTDSILGLEVVLPDGCILRTGSLFDDGYSSVCAEGPGPDISGIFHASMGIFGICTEMEARLYPLFPHEEIMIVKFEEDDLEGVAEFLRLLAREECTLETILFQDAYLAMGLGVSHEEAEILRGRMPRQNVIIFYGGETEEEMLLNRSRIESIIEMTDAELAPEGMLEMIKELVNWKKVFRLSSSRRGSRG